MKILQIFISKILINVQKPDTDKISPNIYLFLLKYITIFAVVHMISSLISWMIEVLNKKHVSSIWKKIYDMIRYDMIWYDMIWCYLPHKNYTSPAPFRLCVISKRMCFFSRTATLLKQHCAIIWVFFMLRTSNVHWVYLVILHLWTFQSAY